MPESFGQRRVHPNGHKVRGRASGRAPRGSPPTRANLGPHGHPMVTRHVAGATAHHRNPRENWSGRPDSTRPRPAWEAGILPLNYGRTCAHSSPDTLEVNDLRGPRMAPHSPIFAPRLALRRAASAVFRRSAASRDEAISRRRGDVFYFVSLFVSLRPMS